MEIHMLVKVIGINDFLFFLNNNTKNRKKGDYFQ